MGQLMGLLSVANLYLIFLLGYYFLVCLVSKVGFLLGMRNSEGVTESQPVVATFS